MKSLLLICIGKQKYFLFFSYTIRKLLPINTAKFKFFYKEKDKILLVNILFYPLLSISGIKSAYIEFLNPSQGAERDSPILIDYKNSIFNEKI